MNCMKDKITDFVVGLQILLFFGQMSKADHLSKKN